MQGRASRSKRGGSAPAGATLPHGSAVTKVNVPELGAQAAAPPGSDKLTALAEQVANMKAQADAAQAHSFKQLEHMAASQQQMAALLQHARGLFPPLWCFPPRCLGADSGLLPLRFLCRA